VIGMKGELFFLGRSWWRLVIHHYRYLLLAYETRLLSTVPGFLEPLYKWEVYQIKQYKGSFNQLFLYFNEYGGWRVDYFSFWHIKYVRFTPIWPFCLSWIIEIVGSTFTYRKWCILLIG
jgi:hypothetical protein